MMCPYSGTRWVWQIRQKGFETDIGFRIKMVVNMIFYCSYASTLLLVVAKTKTKIPVVGTDFLTVPTTTIRNPLFLVLFLSFFLERNTPGSYVGSFLFRLYCHDTFAVSFSFYLVTHDIFPPTHEEEDNRKKSKHTQTTKHTPSGDATHAYGESEMDPRLFFSYE